MSISSYIPPIHPSPFLLFRWGKSFWPCMIAPISNVPPNILKIKPLNKDTPLYYFNSSPNSWGWAKLNKRNSIFLGIKDDNIPLFSEISAYKSKQRNKSLKKAYIELRSTAMGKSFSEAEEDENQKSPLGSSNSKAKTKSKKGTTPKIPRGGDVIISSTSSYTENITDKSSIRSKRSRSKSSSSSSSGVRIKRGKSKSSNDWIENSSPPSSTTENFVHYSLFSDKKQPVSPTLRNNFFQIIGTINSLANSSERSEEITPLLFQVLTRLEKLDIPLILLQETRSGFVINPLRLFGSENNPIRPLATKIIHKWQNLIPHISVNRPEITPSP